MSSYASSSATTSRRISRRRHSTTRASGRKPPDYRRPRPPAKRRTLLQPDYQQLNQHHYRLFDEPAQRRDQLGAERAVDYAVIAGESHRHHAGESHAALLGLYRLPPRGAYRKDSGVRRIDDGGEFADAIHAEIGDRPCT